MYLVNKYFHLKYETRKKYILGLFAPCHMPYDKDRDLSDNGQPSIEEMTIKALKILKNSPNGFLLIVNIFFKFSLVKFCPTRNKIKLQL